MQLFEIQFKSGKVIQEYGDSVADVREFCSRVFSDEVIESVSKLNIYG